MKLDLAPGFEVDRPYDVDRPSRSEITHRPFQVDSETGRLNAVLLASPAHLALVPSNVTSIQSLRAGHRPDRSRAVRQHRALRQALEAEGVEVIDVPGRPDLVDIAFTRDTTLMTPWGLVGLRPGAPHRRDEVPVMLAAAAAYGLPLLGQIQAGRVEGGDIAILRPGLVIVGVSGERTDEVGADRLAGLFEARGWRVLRHALDPHFLHLDTVFTMIDANLALGCVDSLGQAFVDRLAGEGVEILPVDRNVADGLGCNVLSLGEQRVVMPEGCARSASVLAERGYRTITVDISEFTRCGGGVHCLTMPLDRSRA